MNAPTSHIYRPNDFLTVVFAGKPLTIRTSDSAFNQAVEAFFNQEWDALLNIINPTLGIAKATENFDDIEVRDNAVFYQGTPVHGVIVDRILLFREKGADMKPLVKFLAKLMLNPSKRAVDELYKFLEHKNLPVTENGNFLAYKGVTSEYWSITSGKAKLLKGRDNERGQIFNGVGEEIQIPRNQVDDNKEVGCSYGLHAGSLEYASGFKGGGKLMIVEIDPADVVSIPTDCNCQKLRTCRYKVVGEFEGELTDAFYSSRFRTENDDVIDDQFDDEEFLDDGLFDADGEPIEEGTVYEKDGTLYTWDNTVQSFVGLLNKNNQLSDAYASDMVALDEDERVDQDGNALVDGELYKSDEETVDTSNVYRWVEEDDLYVSVRPDDGSTLTYLEGYEQGMVLVS